MKRWANGIGHNLAKIRISRGLTQEQLAAKIQINGAGTTRQVIANIESRRRRVFESHLREFVKVLRCSYDDLFLGPQPSENNRRPSRSTASRR